MDGIFEIQRRNSDGKHELFSFSYEKEKKKLLGAIESVTRICAISTPCNFKMRSSAAWPGL
jgi:hypothetical protein